MRRITILLVMAIAMFVSLPAQATTLSSAEFDQTSVLEDLSSATADGQPFDYTQYTYDTTGSVQLISLIEYCYSPYVNMQDNYNLYFYIYNPTAKDIADITVQIATSYSDGQAVEYSKLELDIVATTVEAGLYNIILKAKLQDPSIMLDIQQDTQRQYDISGIEVQFDGESKQDYLVGGSYIFTGYATGYGPSNSDSLTSTVTELEVVQTTVYGTTYRFQNSLSVSKQINSVYFGVDTSVILKYGNLQQITAQWFETLTQWAVVAENQSMYNALLEWVGVDIGSGYNSAVPYSLYTAYGGGSSYLWSYNSSAISFNSLNKLVYLFNGVDSNAISSSEVVSYMEDYTANSDTDLILGKYSSELFVESVDTGATYGQQTLTIDADSLFTLEGFDISNGFWEWYLNKVYPDLQGSDYEDISPIHLVTATDFIGSNSAIADRLLVNEADVPALLAEYESNLLAGKNTYLFRFAVRDYTAYDLNGSFGSLELLSLGYVAQQTVFLDFDIISLTFNRDGVYTNIPVVADPIDVIGGYDPPIEAGADWSWLKTLLAIVLGVVLFSLLYKFLDWFTKLFVTRY